MGTIKRRYWGAVLLSLLTGCGGNNTTATSSVSTKISYDGSTSPATLTQANSATLLGGAYQGGQTGNSLSTAAGLSNIAATPRHPRTLILFQALYDAIHRAKVDGATTPGTAAAVADVSDQVAGNCGGQMSYTGTADDASRQFYASFTFDAYCEDSTTITGTASASGQTDATLGFSTLGLSFEKLTISSSGDSFSANGYELITPHAGSVEAGMNMLLQDDATKRVYKTENFNLGIVNGTGSTDISLSGRYYDPSNGFIDVSTPTPLRINNGDYWPSSGVFNAVGNSASASFTSLSGTSYQLDIDTDNDGAADISSTGLWSAL